MSLHPINRAGVKDPVAWEVRWRDGGRGTRAHKRRFTGPTAYKDAELFDIEVRRSKALGRKLYRQLQHSKETVDAFAQEWFDSHVITLQPSTQSNYSTLLDRWIIPALGGTLLQHLDRQTADAFRASLIRARAGRPTINKAMGVLESMCSKAVEWGRLDYNPVAGIKPLPIERDDEAVDPLTADEVELIRAHLPTLRDRVLVSVLAYEGIRPGEAFVLEWGDVLDRQGHPREKMMVRRALSDRFVTVTKSARHRRIQLFDPVARDLLELYLEQGRPRLSALVFPPDRPGRELDRHNRRHLSRHNWRKRVWQPALIAARAAGHDKLNEDLHLYALRHTCATLLAYAGWTPNEMAKHLGHNDPGFTLRVYTETLDDATDAERVPVAEAITRARAPKQRARRKS